MNGLAGFRQQYPQYNDIADDVLAESLHSKYYSDIPKEEYFKQLGINRVEHLDTVAKTFAPTASAGIDSSEATPPQMEIAGNDYWQRTLPSIKAAPGVMQEATSQAIPQVLQYTGNLDEEIAAIERENLEVAATRPAEPTPEQAAKYARSDAYFNTLLTGLKERRRILQDASSAAGAEIQKMLPQEQTIAGEVVTSVASSAPAAIAGIGAGLATKNPFVGMAVGAAAGGLQQAGQTQEQALQLGASSESAHAAATRAGIYEAGGDLLGLHVLLGPGKTLLGKIIKGLAAEAGQEIATQFTEDVDAKLSYNPNLTVAEVAHNALIAGLSGAAMGAILSPITYSAQKAQEGEFQNKMTKLAEAETERSLARLPSPDEVVYKLLMPEQPPLDFNAAGGIVTGQPEGTSADFRRRPQPALTEATVPTAIAHPPSEYVQTNAEVSTINPLLVQFNELGEQLISAGLQPVLEIPGARELADQLRGIFIRLQETSTARKIETVLEIANSYLAHDDLTLRTLSEIAVTQLKAGQGDKLKQQMLAHSYVTALVRYADDLRARAMGQTFAMRQNTVLKPTGSGFGLSGVRIDASTDPVQVGQLTPTKRLADGSITVAGFNDRQLSIDILNILQAWVKTLGGVKFPLVVMPMNDSTSVRGQAWIDYSGNHYIHLNPRAIFTKATKTGQQLQPLAVETLAHELGHLVGANMFVNSPKEVQQAVLKAWNADQLAALNKSFAEWKRGERGIMALADGGELTSATIEFLIAREYSENFDRFVRDYLLNFDEWMAHNFEKVLSGDVYGWQSPVRKFIVQVFNAFKKFFDTIQHQIAPNTTFKMFLDYHIARNKLENEGMRLWAVEQAIKRARSERAPGGVEDIKLAREVVLNTVPEDVGAQLGRVMSWGERATESPDFEEDLTRWSWFKRKTYTLLQVAKLNPHIKELYDPLGVRDPITGKIQHGYIDYVLQWARERMLWMNRADERLHQWRQLSRAEQSALAEFTYAQVEGEKYLDTNDPVIRARFKLTDNVVALAEKLDQDFKAFMTAMEDTLLEEAMLRIAHNPFVSQELVQIRKRFDALRSKPYAPMIRYGEYIVKVIATRDGVQDGRAYKAGDTIYREHFDSKRQQNNAVSVIKGMYPGHSLKLDRLPDNIRSLAGMPGPLLEALKGRLQLTEEQQKELQQYMYEIAPAQSFVKRLMQRRGVKGYSFDLQRSYANYFFHGANHIARVKYNTLLRDAISRMDSAANALGGDVVNRREIANYLKAHFDYIMNPKDDWAQARAVVAISYLGGIIKTAVVNLTQVPLMTYPVLAERYGDAKAIAALQRAYRDQYKAYRVLKPMTKAQEAAINNWVQGKALTPTEEAFVKAWSGMPAEKRDALLRAQKEGFIDESQAMELAAMSEGNWLSRYKATDEVGYYARSVAQGIMIPFQLAEKLNRRVTFMAAWDLATEQGLRGEAAFQAARDAVTSSQFEYAKWNRPELLRGKKGLFLMFMQYQLSTIHEATDGFSPNPSGWNWRWWALMFASAGALGLPFAENLLDVAEWLLLKARPNVRTNLRYELKKLVGEFADKIHASPDIFMHGLSRYGYGLVPFADLSGSVSMGRIVPGTDIPLALAEGADWNTAVSKAVTEAGGATSSLVLRMMQAVSSDNPDVWKRIEGGLPMTMLQQQSASLRWFVRGAEQNQQGGNLVTFDPSDPWQSAELAGKALGFQPQRLSAAREDAHIKSDFANFYHIRRSMLLKAVAEAHIHGDAEAVAQTVEAIRAYNREIPVKALSITGDQLRASLVNRLQQKGREDAGFGANRQAEIVRQATDAGQF